MMRIKVRNKVKAKVRVGVLVVRLPTFHGYECRLGRWWRIHTRGHAHGE